MFVDVN